MDLKKTIGRRIRMLRNARSVPSGSGKRRSLTIQELADAAQLSMDYVNKLELGRYMPSGKTLIALAGALDVPVAQLFPDPSARSSSKQRALDELSAFCAQFSAAEVRYLLHVVEAVMERP
jgi:transcriptional regulator with XRE-family HTH domain